MAVKTVQTPVDRLKEYAAREGDPELDAIVIALQVRDEKLRKLLGSLPAIEAAGVLIEIVDALILLGDK